MPFDDTDDDLFDKPRTTPRVTPRPTRPSPDIDPDTALPLIAKYESGDRNIPNYRYDPTHTAQGHYQITNTNWRTKGPQAGVDLKQYPSAMAAPKEVQAKVAKLMYGERGFADWAPFNPRLRAAIGGGQGRQQPRQPSDDDLFDAPPKQAKQVQDDDLFDQPSGQTLPANQSKLNRVNQPQTPATNPRSSRQPSVPTATEALQKIMDDMNRATGISKSAPQRQAPFIDRTIPKMQDVLTQPDMSPQGQEREAIRKQVIEDRAGRVGAYGAPTTKGTAALFADPVGTLTGLLKDEPTNISEETQRRLESAQRSRTPEMEQIRKEYGEMSAPRRALTQPLVRAAAGLLRVAGSEVTNQLGLSDGDFARWANARATIAEEGTQLAPLDAQGNEIHKGVPEKLTQAAADLGLGIGEIVALKKATGLPLAQLLALESAAKSGDQPLDKRVGRASEAYLMGRALDAHLGKAASAVAFGAPTAVQTGAQVARGEMSPLDALLQTGVQTVAGGVLGGKKPEAPRGETLTQVPDIEGTLAAREARVSPSQEVNIPERPETIKAQLDAVQQGTRPAVLLTKGERSVPIPKGLTAVRTEAGTFYYDPKQISRETILQKVADGTHGEILGHVENKGPTTTEAVVARAPDGTEIQSSAVSPENVDKQAEVLQAQHPDAQIETGGEDLAKQVIAERVEAQIPKEVLEARARIGQRGQNEAQLNPELQSGSGADVPRVAETPPETRAEPLVETTPSVETQPEVADLVQRLEALRGKTDEVGRGVPVDETLESLRQGRVPLKDLQEWVATMEGYAARPKKVEPTPSVEAEPVAPTETAPTAAQQAPTESQTPTTETERAVAQPQPPKGEAPQVAETPRAATPEPTVPKVITDARARKAKPAADKAEGIEYRRAGADPYEIIDDLLDHGWEVYSKAKPKFDEWAKEMRDKFGEVVEPHLKKVYATLTGAAKEESATETPQVETREPTVPAEAAAPRAEREPSDRTTSIKNAVVEAERELQGLPQFEKARRAHPQSFDEGVADVRDGTIKPRELAADIVRAFNDPAFSRERFQSRRPRPLTTEESMALLYDRMRISHERRAAEKELDAANQSGDEARITKAVDEVNRLQQASNNNDEADTRAGTEQARGLAIRREMIKDDYSRARVMANAQARNKGQPLPEKVQAKLDEVTQQLQKATDRITELESARQQGRMKADTDKFIREQKLEIRKQGRARTREGLKAERADLKTQFAQAWARTKPKSTTLSMGGLGDLDPKAIGELSQITTKIARNLIEDGVTRAADLVDGVHNELKDVADVTKRDVSDLISGYGRVKQATENPVERKLNELKSILAANSGRADVLEEGIRPKRRGQQREKPTEDQRRALRELQDAMKERGPELAQRPQDVATEQGTPLDKAKTTVRNRIEQLQKWLSEGKREVEGRARVIPDAELKQLQAEREGLERAAKLLNDPEADQRAVEKRLTEINKSITELQTQIRTNQTSTQPKEGASSRWSPEIGQLEKERDVLRRVASDMRVNEAREARNKPQENASFYGAEMSWADFEKQAKKTLAAQKSWTTAKRKQINDLNRELEGARRGEKKETVTKEPLAKTEEMKAADQEANKLRRQIDDIYSVIDWQNKTKLQKGLAYGAAGVRASVLSGLKVLGKIGGALTQRIPQQYIEEVAGSGWAKVFPEIAAKAPRHGTGLNLAAEKEFGRGLAQGVKEIPRMVKSGESNLSLEHGTRYPNIPTKAGTVLAIPGRIHAAEKNILKQGEYRRSLENNLQWAEKQGLDRNNPEVVEQAKARAYKDAEEVILMGDNAFSRFLRRGRQGMSDEGRSLLKMVVPVERVPSNYLSQMIGDYGFGIARGAMRAIRQRHPDILKNLTPEESDKTMRLLKRGSLGMMYAGLAASGLVKLGGYYSPKRKEEGQPEVGDIKIGPATISHTWTHSPPTELAQLVATIKRDKDAGAAVKGIIGQTPFAGQLTRDWDTLARKEGGMTLLGEHVADWLEPQLMKEFGQVIDRKENGEVTRNPLKGEAVKRKVVGFGAKMKEGLPIIRESLPERTPPRPSIDPYVAKFRSGRLGEDELQTAVDKGTITEAEAKRIKREGSMSIQEADFSKRKPQDALDTFQRLSPSQRERVREIMERKAWSLLYSDSMEGSATEKERKRAKLQQQFDRLGIEPKASSTNRGGLRGAVQSAFA